LAFVKCTNRTYSTLLKILFFCSIYKSVSLGGLGFAKQIMRILRILCYNGSLVTWKDVSLTASKLKKPLIVVRAIRNTNVLCGQNAEL
jgi:hypothetical protein